MVNSKFKVFTPFRRLNDCDYISLTIIKNDNNVSKTLGNQKLIQNSKSNSFINSF